jgi:hypothetical protein
MRVLLIGVGLVGLAQAACSSCSGIASGGDGIFVFDLPDGAK